jgi:hypothetical protein
MLKFDASIFGGELPVGLGVVGIAHYGVLDQALAK